MFNDTDQDLYISDYKTIHRLPPGESSRDIGLFDTDSIIINGKTQVFNKKLDSGVFRFCDITNVVVIKKGGEIILKPSIGYFACSNFSYPGIYDKIDDAFKF